MSNNLTKIPIRVTTGTETQKDGTCKFMMFHVEPNGEEVFLGKFLDTAAKEVMRKVGQVQFECAVAGQRAEVGGRWSTTTFETAEGCLFKVFGSHRKSWNAVMKRAAIFLVPRANAALVTIKMDTLQVAGKSRMQDVTLTGRFDILSPSQVKEEFGYQQQSHLEKYHSQSLVDSLFTISVKESAIAPRIVIETKIIQSPDGESLVIKTRRRTRNIEV